MSLTHIDFFINNRCNLHCKHCYVNPRVVDRQKVVRLDGIIRALDEAISLGVRTIGCTGKEPLLTFGRTREVFEHLYNKKKQGANILYGIVTNGTLLDSQKAKTLNDLELDYLDVSLDGTEEVHDSVRGRGNYKRTMGNLETLLDLKLPHLNSRNIFIDFTLGRYNNEDLPDFITAISEKGLQNIYISPYLSIKKNDRSVLTRTEYASVVKGVLDKSEKYKGVNVYFKNDYSTRDYVEEIKRRGILDFDNLYRDEIGNVYSIIKKNGNKIYINLLGEVPNHVVPGMVRINSNGDYTTCEYMFRGQKYKTFGNIRDAPLSIAINRMRNKSHN